MSKLISKVAGEIEVYDDGTTIFKPISLGVNVQVSNNSSFNCSARLRQILDVLDYMKRDFENSKKSNINYMVLKSYRNAVLHVASKWGVKETSVRDKITRQINKSTEEICQIIKDYLENSGNELETLLRENIGAHTVDGDLEAIEDFFRD